jgi:hypothetical protein
VAWARAHTQGRSPSVAPGMPVVRCVRSLELGSTLVNEMDVCTGSGGIFCPDVENVIEADAGVMSSVEACPR